MDDVQCSFYRNVHDSNSKHVVPALNILMGIQEGRWKEHIEYYRSLTDEDQKKQYKTNLPCATFSGTFSQRKTSGLISYSNIIVLDIDNLNPAKLKRLKKNLMGDANIAAYFVSPSHGLKVFFYVNSNEDLHKDCAFPQLQKYMLHHYDTKVDSSGKNLDRLCFISYDPEIYYNPEHATFQVDPDYRPEIEREAYMNGIRNLPDGKEISHDATYIFKMCIRWTNNRFKYSKGNRNNYIHALACNLNRCGLNQDVAIHMINAKYNTPDYKWINSVRGVYKRNAAEHNTVPIWKNAEKQIKVFQANLDLNAKES